MTQQTLNQSDLAHFTGTENWYRHNLIKNILYTDGAKYVAEQGGAYWLLDQIAINQQVKEVAAQGFQVWDLLVNDDSSASLVCTDGNNNIIHTDNIPYTDFPMPLIRFYLTDNVILLPSEY